MRFEFARLFFVDGFLGLFDERQDVAHAEDARDDAVRMKLLEASYFSPMPTNFTGAPVTLPNGERRAAARVAVELGENDSGDAEAFVEFSGGANRVLTDHSVGDEENFRWAKVLF